MVTDSTLFASNLRTAKVLAKLTPCRTLTTDFRSLRYKPGEGHFFTTERSINVYLGRLKSQPEATDLNALEQFSSLIDEASSKAATHQEFTAVLDCVVLEDVGPIGPDSTNFKSRGWDRRTSYDNLRGNHMIRCVALLCFKCMCGSAQYGTLSILQPRSIFAS